MLEHSHLRCRLMGPHTRRCLLSSAGQTASDLRGCLVAGWGLGQLPENLWMCVPMALMPAPVKLHAACCCLAAQPGQCPLTRVIAGLLKVPERSPGLPLSRHVRRFPFRVRPIYCSGTSTLVIAEQAAQVSQRTSRHPGQGRPGAPSGPVAAVSTVHPCWPAGDPCCRALVPGRMRATL